MQENDMEGRHPVLMGTVNLTPDSFFAPSRVSSVSEAMDRVERLRGRGCSIFDLGAVSTRPGAADVPVEEEWTRLEPVLRVLPQALEEGERISVDTTSALVVRRCFDLAGPFVVNDISAGEDDPDMLPLVAELGLTFIAMHKRGNPRSMDFLTDYPSGVVNAVLEYFRAFERRASELGISDWILDPGFGFAKTVVQNWELLENLSRFKVFGRPVLAGVADKRFTLSRNPYALSGGSGAGCSGSAYAEELAVRRGADILRIH